jgi:hypothetical protein
MKAQTARPASPKADVVAATASKLDATASSNAAVQASLTDARSGGASPEEAVPSLLSSVKTEIPHKS